ncbi:hypothetical protein ACFOWE_14660 [Planomonospora corallina]|uniref:Uncharacterized protein n=1 Tax=Planomonospora corallina TaxID=1806052 RepID=A0ABV8I5R3_9ACTN
MEDLWGIFGIIFAFIAFFTLLALMWAKATRQKQVPGYTDPIRALELTGRVRQLKVRGREEEAVRLVEDELAMPADQARSWVRSV